MLTPEQIKQRREERKYKAESDYWVNNIILAINGKKSKDALYQLTFNQDGNLNKV